jgi:hypothetical protein
MFILPFSKADKAHEKLNQKQNNEISRIPLPLPNWK